MHLFSSFPCQATGILHDIGYYKKIIPEPSEEFRIKESSTAVDMRCGSRWTWDKYKFTTALETSSGHTVPFRPPHAEAPNTPKLTEMFQKRQDSENMQGIIDACKRSRRLRMTVRRVMMGWQMRCELAAVIVWIENMLRQVEIPPDSSDPSDALPYMTVIAFFGSVRWC